MPNILLINPHTPEFVRHRDKSIPLGLLYLASTLKSHNYNVGLIDVNNDLLIPEHKGEGVDIDKYFLTEFVSRLNSFKPDLIGIGCLFSGRFKNAIAISRIIKKYYPEIPIVLGGLHPTIFPREILEDYPHIEYIILGEGEASSLRLIESHFNNKEALEQIDGIAFRKGGNITVNEKKSFIDDLDKLAFPAYEILNLKDYYFDTKRWYNPKRLAIDIPLPILSSRACPYRCVFCSMHMTHGTKFRPRSARNVVDEIEYLYKKYNHRYFSFVDDNLTFNKARTLDICNEIIYRGLDIQFDTPNGLSIKHLDKEAMDGLVKAGLIRVCVAPESGSDFIRNKVIRKGLSRNEIYSFFDIIKDYKELYVKAFFVIGFPEETSQTLNDTYEMIKQIPVQQISIFNAVPFPGTPLFEQCKREGLIDIPLDNLHNLDTFANYNESDTPFIKPYKLKLQSLMEFRQKAYDYISHRNPRNSVSLLNKNG
jgi:radical SAM superfamily enzyme YgiQ (UPF0313 family)